MIPTKEEIEEARTHAAALVSDVCLCGHPRDEHYHGECEDEDCGCEGSSLEEDFDALISATKILLAATAPHEDIPRPEDMAELARLVAAELRDRGFRALAESTDVYIPRPSGKVGVGARIIWGHVGLHRSDFDNLAPREIADVIQAEERRRAREWAGDE